MSRRLAMLVVAVLVCAPLLAGCARPPKEEPAPPSQGQTAPPPQKGQSPPSPMSVALYFADAEGVGLARTQGTVSSAETAPLDAVRRLIQGPPKGSGLMATIPADTTVNCVDVEDGLASVDLGASFRDEFPDGSNIGYLCVYSIVHTLCDLPGIQRVRLLIGGKPVDSLGQMDMRQPLTPDPNLISGGQ